MKKVFAVLFCLTVLSSFASAQNVEPNAAQNTTQNPVQPATNDSVPKRPTITPVKGGYFVQWQRLTDVGFVQLPGNVTGPLEIFFDIRRDQIDQKPTPPTNPEILLPIADYWNVRGKPERAIPLYQRGLETDPDNFTFQNNLAYLLSSAQGDHEGGLRIVDQALEKLLDNVTLLDTKGLILIKAGRADEAVPVLERAVTLSCQGPIYMLHLAQALDETGNSESAKNYFDKTRPLLEGPDIKLSKENQQVFDDLKMKYGTVGE